MSTTKVVTLIFSLIYASGFIWYPGDSFSTVDAFALLAVVSGLIVSLFPNERISTLLVKYALLVIDAIGLLGLISLRIIDLSRGFSSYDYIGSSLDFIFIALLVSIGMEIYQKDVPKTRAESNYPNI